MIPKFRFMDVCSLLCVIFCLEQQNTQAPTRLVRSLWSHTRVVIRGPTILHFLLQYQNKQRPERCALRNWRQDDEDFGSVYVISVSHINMLRVLLFLIYNLTWKPNVWIMQEIEHGKLCFSIYLSFQHFQVLGFQQKRLICHFYNLSNKLRKIISNLQRVNTMYELLESCQIHN